ncbi:MAG: hypothetical protein GWM98_24785 [Nitrospinaceae bacterium]|nr:hypothetical protein [Nitrospinaceae bacterium]NIR57093.1 hypothetical protein [Nitrospinaceae bacterium]NIS87534.1 hypothetical protein [Nitrospinaceae bacterium]NIT84404.1 hypothetical protein [Nitrospinaceae bacterium]NIU46591.1 hypothetical protein [Nitrospinaceae bacterium]
MAPPRDVKVSSRKFRRAKAPEVKQGFIDFGTDQDVVGAVSEVQSTLASREG